MKMSLFKDIVLGIDIGGTTCKCGVFTTDGTLVYKDEIPTRKDEGGSLILSDIKEHIPELVKAAGRSCDEEKMEQSTNVLILAGVYLTLHRLLKI